MLRLLLCLLFLSAGVRAQDCPTDLSALGNPGEQRGDKNRRRSRRSFLSDIAIPAGGTGLVSVALWGWHTYKRTPIRNASPDPGFLSGEWKKPAIALLRKLLIASDHPQPDRSFELKVPRKLQGIPGHIIDIVPAPPLVTEGFILVRHDEPSNTLQLLETTIIISLGLWGDFHLRAERHGSRLQISTSKKKRSEIDGLESMSVSLGGR